MKQKPIKRRRINAVSVTLMLKMLQEGPATVHDLREPTGLCLFTVRGYVLTMYREGVIRIAEWEQDSRGRYVTAAYVMGPGKDCKKPAPKNRSALNRQYRERLKQMKIQQAVCG